jgi:hypothetical protein
MKLNRKLLVVALASALPWMSAYAQSPADLQREIELLKGQLKMLSDKIEAMSVQAEPAAITQQVTRLEQKMDLAEEDTVKSGFKGLNVKAVVEVAYHYDDMSKVHTFAAQSGNGSYDSVTPANSAMIELTKETESGEGINWTLRLEPGARGAAFVHEASLSAPINASTRVIAGALPDWTGYEQYFAHQNPLITHNALFDFTAAVSYAGAGLTYTINPQWTAKWVVGNIDGGVDEANVPSIAPMYTKKSTGIAYNVGWTISEYAFLEYSGVIGSGNRNFSMHELDGSFTRGDWLFNGQVGFGSQQRAAANLDADGTAMEARWWTLSGLMGYKVTPRLQLLARADYINNEENGGGLYAWNGDSGFSQNYGIGSARNSDGSFVADASGNAVGANLTRLTFGTNYLVNKNTQWKTEYRIDKSSGYNFTKDGSPDLSDRKVSVGTSLVVSF